MNSKSKSQTGYINSTIKNQLGADSEDEENFHAENEEDSVDSK